MMEKIKIGGGGAFFAYKRKDGHILECDDMYNTSPCNSSNMSETYL